MNGMQLGDKKLVVQRASVGSKTMPAQVFCLLSLLTDLKNLLWRIKLLVFLNMSSTIRKFKLGRPF